MDQAAAYGAEPPHIGRVGLNSASLTGRASYGEEAATR
jgi:hypothetical protein